MKIDRIEPLVENISTKSMTCTSPRPIQTSTVLAADCGWVFGPKKIQNNGQTTKPGKSGIKRIYFSHLFQLILYINTC
jgi:hypothetical protein